MNTMSISDNDTSKIFHTTYCLKKLNRIETYLLDEIDICESLVKKQFNKSVTDAILIASTSITEEISIATFASGVRFPLATVIT